MATRNRQVKWDKPVQQHSKIIRTSKCGRFRIVTRRMASGRNGHFNAKAYSPEFADGKRIGKDLRDTLTDALDAVEQANDPNWEPEES